MYSVRLRLANVRDPNDAILILSLVESLVKNGTGSFHTAINDEGFMNEMAKFARKYSSRTDADTRKVAELVLEIIQSWGEAFLPYSNKYPNIVRTYHDLRKERLPFKLQYDPARAPIFTPPDGQSSSSVLGGGTDAVLAASLAATQSPVASSRAIPAVSPRAQSSLGEPARDREGSLAFQISHGVTVLSEMIGAAISVDEVIADEFGVLTEVTTSLSKLLVTLERSMEEILVSNPEGVERLFELNEQATKLLMIHKNLLSRAMALDDAKRNLPKSKPDPEPTPTTAAGTSVAPDDRSAADPALSSGAQADGEQTDLLDLFDVLVDAGVNDAIGRVKPVEAAATAPAPAPVVPLQTVPQSYARAAPGKTPSLAEPAPSSMAPSVKISLPEGMGGRRRSSSSGKTGGTVPLLPPPRAAGLQALAPPPRDVPRSDGNAPGSPNLLDIDSPTDSSAAAAQKAVDPLESILGISASLPTIQAQQQQQQQQPQQHEILSNNSANPFDIF